jgi:hypothetical protein
VRVSIKNGCLEDLLPHPLVVAAVLKHNDFSRRMNQELQQKANRGKISAHAGAVLPESRKAANNWLRQQAKSNTFERPVDEVVQPDERNTTDE